jgi:hypothetical protein
LGRSLIQRQSECAECAVLIGAWRRGLSGSVPLDAALAKRLATLSNQISTIIAGTHAQIAIQTVHPAALFSSPVKTEC